MASPSEGDLTPMAMLSESQHMMLSSQMIDAKQARAKAEAERQMRLNRIARLQNEEMKLMKRIEETHKRTKDILTQKAARERAAIERQNLEVARTEERNHQRIELLDRKTRQRANIRSSQEAAWINRHHMVQSVRQKKEWIQEESTYRRQSDLHQRQQQRDDVRRQHQVRRERKKLAHEMMSTHLRAEQEARKAAEEGKIRAQESRLAELERKEMRLLQSLQSYQGEQREALQEVDAYLGPRRSRTVSPPGGSDAGSSARGGRRGLPFSRLPDSAPGSGQPSERGGAGGPGLSYPRSSPPAPAHDEDSPPRGERDSPGAGEGQRPERPERDAHAGQADEVAAAPAAAPTTGAGSGEAAEGGPSSSAATGATAPAAPAGAAPAPPDTDSQAAAEAGDAPPGEGERQ